MKATADRAEVIKWLDTGRCPACGFTFKACTCGPMVRMLLYIAAENRAAESELREMREALERIGNEVGAPVAEYYSARSQRNGFMAIVGKVSGIVQQALARKAGS